MAKGENQKLKLLYLAKILLEKTDEEHAIDMAEIISSLEAYGVVAERKSIYDDLECLRRFGIDIIGESQGRTFYYHVGSRDFELAELKLLVDAVQSSKFITPKKSNELIKKLESFASKYEAKQLQRQVTVAGRVKTMNESIYYSVDAIHSAIAENVQVSFQYLQWTVDKKMKPRHEGAVYKVSPWALLWDNENYYMVAYDSTAERIKHFRVDKMKNISQTAEKREGKEAFKQFDMAVYAKKMFSMYGGKEETVKLQCENELAGAMIDRFGKDIMLHKVDEEYFTVNVDVAVSSQFLHWVMSLGTGIKIVAPKSVVKQVQDEIKRLSELYK